MEAYDFYNLSLRVQVNGGEQYLGFAKKKLAQMKELMSMTGTPVLRKNIDMGDALIFIQSMCGYDLIRIVGVGAGYYIFNVEGILKTQISFQINPRTGEIIPSQVKIPITFETSNPHIIPPYYYVPGTRNLIVHSNKWYRKHIAEVLSPYRYVPDSGGFPDYIYPAYMWQPALSKFGVKQQNTLYDCGSRYYYTSLSDDPRTDNYDAEYMTDPWVICTGRRPYTQVGEVVDFGISLWDIDGDAIGDIVKYKEGGEELFDNGDMSLPAAAMLTKERSIYKDIVNRKLMVGNVVVDSYNDNITSSDGTPGECDT